MSDYTGEKALEKWEKDEIETLIEILDQEAFLYAGVMLEQLTQLQRNGNVERNIVKVGVTVKENEKPLDGEALISHVELIKMVNVQYETIMRYIREGKMIPDQVGEDLKFYFKISNVRTYAKNFGWDIITEKDFKKLFYEVLSESRMSYSYKPVLIKAMLKHAELSSGTCLLGDVVTYFRTFYAERRRSGLFIERERSVFSKADFSDKEAKQVILIYPYKRFADMQLMYYIKESQVIGFNPCLWQDFSDDEKIKIERICDNALKQYYDRFKMGKSINSK